MLFLKQEDCVNVNVSVDRLCRKAVAALKSRSGDSLLIHQVIFTGLLHKSMGKRLSMAINHDRYYIQDQRQHFFEY